MIMNYIVFKTIYISLGVGELEFHFNSSNEDVFIGLAPIDNTTGYCVSFNNETHNYKNLKEVLNAPIFNNKTLEEVWNDVVIDCIDGMNEEDYLDYIHTPNFYLSELIAEYELTGLLDINFLVRKLIDSEYQGNILLYAGTKELKDYSNEDEEYKYYIYDTFNRGIYLLKKENSNVSFSYNCHWFMRNKIDLTDTFVGRKYDRFSNASAIDKSERYKKMIKYERLLTKDILVAVFGILVVISFFVLMISIGLKNIVPGILVAGIVFFVLSVGLNLAINIPISKKTNKLKEELFPKKKNTNTKHSKMFETIIEESKQNGFYELHEELMHLDKRIKMYGGFYEDGVVDLQFISKEHEFFLTFYNTFVLIEIDEESIDKKIKLTYDQYKDLYELEGKIFSVLSDYL